MAHAVPDSLPVLPADEARLRSFHLDEAVRLHTAGKCYRPHRTLCANPRCLLPVSGREFAAWRQEPDGRVTVYHARCVQLAPSANDNAAGREDSL